MNKDIKRGSKEADEYDILCTLVEKYENEHYPIPSSHPIEAIKFRMEQLDMKTHDLVAIIGGKSRASKILNKKEGLTLKMIRKIHEALKIPLEILVREYALH
jgi:HTH-type transcriptional regulator/antitoxin HigA